MGRVPSIGQTTHPWGLTTETFVSLPLAPSPRSEASHPSIKPAHETEPRRLDPSVPVGINAQAGRKAAEARVAKQREATGEASAASLGSGDGLGELRVTQVGPKPAVCNTRTKAGDLIEFRCGKARLRQSPRLSSPSVGPPNLDLLVGLGPLPVRPFSCRSQRGGDEGVGVPLHPAYASPPPWPSAVCRRSGIRGALRVISLWSSTRATSEAQGCRTPSSWGTGT